MRKFTSSLRRYFIITLLFFTSFTVLLDAVRSPTTVQAASTYYLSSSGDDSNPGTSSLPWKTPYHSLTCGDVIYASPGIYSAQDFQRFGYVSCPDGNKVAWLICQQLSQCILSIAYSGNDLNIDQSYWGVQGWYAENTGRDQTWQGSCFNVLAASNTPIHHIIFANNVGVGCPQTGFGAGIKPESVGNGGTPVSIDYVAYVGNLASGNGYNRLAGSNFSVYGPINYDTKPGTHIYWAQNFAFSAVNVDCTGQSPDYCKNYDANGIIIDSPGNQTQDGAPEYTQQIVMESNIALHNEGVGFRPEFNNVANNGNKNGPHAHILVRYNTAWGNAQSPYQQGGDAGEFQAFNTTNVTFDHNLAVTSRANAYVSRYPLAPLQMDDTDTSNVVSSNWLFSPYQSLNASGYYPNSVVPSADDTNTTYSGNGNPFPVGPFEASNTVGVDPQLTSPVVPQTVNRNTCQGYTTVIACMSQVATSFAPLNAAAQSTGYQPPNQSRNHDDIFPGWLCGTKLPAGITTIGCGRAGGTVLGML